MNFKVSWRSLWFIKNIFFLFILFNYFILLFGRYSIIKSKALEILNNNLFSPNFLFFFFLFGFLSDLLNLFCSGYLNLFFFFFAFSFLNSNVFCGFLLFSWLDFDTSKFHLDLFSEQSFVLLDDGWFIVDVSILRSYYSSFLQVFEGSTVSSLFHEEKLFSIPGIQVDWLDEWVNNSVLPVPSCAIQT